METLRHSVETKAAIEHKCNFCGEKIFKNTIYYKSTHKGDDGLYDWKTHVDCENLAQILNMYKDCEEGVTQDDFVEIVGYAHDDLLIELLPIEDHKKYSDVIQQIRHVRWIEKLRFVIRKKLYTKI